MLPFLNRTINLNSIKRVNFESYNILFRANVKNIHLRPVNYSNIAVCAQLITSKRRNGSFDTFTNDVRWQHNEIEKIALNNTEKYTNLLGRVQEIQKDFSPKLIRSYVEEIRSLLEDLAFEDHHRQKLLESQSFIELLKMIHKSINEMSVNDIRSTLDFCRFLKIPYDSELCFAMVIKLKDNFIDLDFSAKIDLRHFLMKLHFSTISTDRQSIKKFVQHVERRILEDIQNKIYLKLPKDTAAALSFVQFCKFIPSNLEADVLSAVLELKKWDDPLFFRCFLKKSDSRDAHLNDEYLKRIKEEIVSNDRFLDVFLNNYAHAVDENILRYDNGLVDDVVNKLLLCGLKEAQIRRIVSALSRMRHSHYELIKYLIEFLRSNPSILASHPVLSSQIIQYMACCAYNSKSKNRWEIAVPILKDNSNLIHMLDYWRKDMNRYLYLLVQLASLGIFINDEINYLLKFCQGGIFTKHPGKIQLFLLSLNQGIKVFYPDFSESLLSRGDVSFAIKKFCRLSSSPNILKKWELLDIVGEHLKKTSGVSNCILPMCNNKFGFHFDAFVAVNDKGQLHDFGASHQSDFIYVEDISLPEDFRLVAIYLLAEKQYSRNTLDLEASSALRLKITELLGFPTVVIYEPIFRKINENEKGNYLYKAIVG